MNKYFLVMAFLMLFAALSATVLLTDNFTGSVGTNLTDPANGWSAHSGAGETPMKIGNTGLTYPGYSGSGIGTATSPSVNGEDINKGFTAVSSGSVYYSFMINTATSADISGYSTHFMQNSSYFYARFWTRRVGANINFGLAKTTAAATWDPTNYANGTTYLIVLKYTFNTASNTDDAVYMFVNPVLGGAEPTPTLSITSGTVTDATSISMVGIRQWNAGTLATFDGIIVATDWADIAGGTLSAPTTQASDLAFTNIAQTQMDVSWTNGDGAKRIVIMNSSNSFTAPANGTDPTADTAWTDSGEQVIYNGSSNTVTVTGLTAGTTYWFRAYEYNGAGTGTLYLTTTATGNPNSQITATGVVLPAVTTAAISAITMNSATSGGEVTADGGGTITARGACWNITGTPTIDDDFTEDGTGTGVFTSSLTGLAAGQQYYVRAYATNSAGTAYGDQVIFSTLKAEPSNHVTGFSAADGASPDMQILVSWTDATGTVIPDGYLVKASAVDYNSIVDPVDGTSESNGTLVRNVSAGTQSYTFTGLSSNTTYYFKVFPYTNSGSSINYKVDGTVPSASHTTAAGPAMTELIVPQYIQGLNGTNNQRLAYATRLTLSNLSPNAIYRYTEHFVLATDTPTSTGAGIAIYVDANGTFTRSTLTSLSTAGQYGEFTTDATGTYTGWFMGEPSGNARFTPGNTLYYRLRLNNGAGGTTGVYYLTTTSSIHVINFGTEDNVNQGTFLYGTSGAPAKKFAFVYDNVTGTGRPIAGNVIESDGLDLTAVTQILPAYKSNVDNITGAWGVIIPNSVGAKGFTGIQRVEARVFETGAIYAANTDPDGVWGDVSTVNPLGGDTTPINLTGEATLPVELSSFTAMLTSQNMVSIQWVTQSESNLNGYYIYRGADSELNDAQIVSPLISATNTSQQQVYQFTDSELSESGTYYYWLQVQEMDGTMSFHGPTSIAFDNNGGNPGTPNIPTVTELKSIFPNPFNPSATIQYALAKDASVNITIYNARGQIVRSFSEGNKTIGTHSVIWNGTDNYGRECGTGIYYFRMQAGSQSYMHKAVLMK